ncbi:MAG: cytochrome c family protein [Chloroflexi bacterium]|nr:cytochrome c family protein [Chloroflexota bacterium]
MQTRKLLVILGGLLVITLLMILTSWAPSAVIAQGPAPATPPPPAAVLKVVPVAGVATDKNAMTTTIKIITDTTVGPSNAVVAQAAADGSNVPVNVPVHLAVSAQDPKNTGKPTWSLTKPADSKAALKDPAAMETEFTPDVEGAYYVQVTLKGDNGTSAPEFAFFNAGTYVGVYTGNCKQCHPTKTEEWAKTGHAVVMPEELDNKIDGPRGIQPSAAGYITHYAETCSACHATGYYPGFTGTGGYFDAKAKANWTFPTWKQIDEVFTKKNPSNYDAVPQGVKDMATIGCEVCHGPASQHVKNGAKVMDVNWSNAVCNQCHGTRGGHTRGLQLAFSKHSDASSSAWTHPTGPEEQACVRCHSAKGYVSFLQNPTNQAAWNNEEQTLTCAGCHDPHSEANPFQLRVVGKPVQVPFTAKDVGLSATCEECHNNRTDPANAVKGSTPHYASDAEMLTDIGGVTYGATVPNSPHGAMVGAAPIPNPSYDPKNGESAQFLFSAIGDTKGNVPGPCVACHMAAAITTAGDPLQYKVGGHSFNTVTPDGKTDYGAACKSCHGAVTDFNMKAKADYDGNGKVEGVQDEVKGLLNVLWTDLEAKGLKKLDTGHPYATLPKNADGSTDPKIANAWYNFRYVYGTMWGSAGPGNEGKAAAIHNFKRSVSLLQLSIKDLTGGLPEGMTELK